jgi:integrase
MGRKTIPGLIQRDGIWHIDKRICGRRICQSTGTGDIQEAEKYLARVMEETRKASVYGVRPERTFEQAAAKFLVEHQHKRSLSSDIVQLKLLMPHVGKLSLHEVHLGKLQPWVELRQKSGKAVGTINHGLKIVRRILNLAAGDWVDENGLTWLRAAPKIRLLPDKRKRSPYPLSWAEQDVLFASLPDYLADMALFAVNTGCRDAEICNLRWEWEVAVPQMRTSVFIIPGDRVKNGEDRLVVVNEVARSVIDRCRGVHATNVFTYRGKPIRRMLTSAWVRARQRTNLSHVRVHDLKHTFGRRLRAAGVSFEDRQDLLGHRSGRITTHYSAAELTRLIEAANRVSSASNQGQGLVVMRGALARVPQNSRSDLKESLKRLVPRGGIEPPTP